MGDEEAGQTTEYEVKEVTGNNGIGRGMRPEESEENPVRIGTAPG